MNNTVIGSVLMTAVALFIFFSMPLTWQIQILKTMRSMGSNFNNSTEWYIEQNKGEEDEQRYYPR